VNPRVLSVRIGGMPATVEFAGLVGAGLYQFNVVVPNTFGGDQAVVAEIGGLSSQPNVFLTVAGDPQPVLTVAPTTLSFRFETGRAAPASQALSVSSSVRSVQFTAAVSTTSGGNWLSLSPASGTTPATLMVSVSPSGLAVGTYAGSVQITAPDAAAGSQTVPVTLTVAPMAAVIPQYRITTLAGIGVEASNGDGGPATNAAVLYPAAVAADSAGNVYIIETGGPGSKIRKVAAGTGIITTVAGAGSGGDGGPAVRAALNEPSGIAVDNAGNIYIAEVEGHRVRKVSAATGIISTIAGTGTPGYSGDGGSATRAQLRAPGDVVLDNAGNVYIADRDNHRVRKLDAGTSIITTIAGTGILGYSGDGGPATSAQLNLPNTLGVDAAGNLYIGDNRRVRKVAAATQIITTVAGTGIEGAGGDGGPGTSAQISSGSFIGADVTGNVYVADSTNHRVRRIDAALGTIVTIAGTGQAGYSGDGGSATNARLNVPAAVAVGRTGNVYVADFLNMRVRVLTPVAPGS